MATLLQDHLFTLKRDCNKADFASQVCVPYDLLEACNPGELEQPKKGQIISLCGLYKVQTGDNVWSVSKKLTTPAHKLRLTSRFSCSFQRFMKVLKADLLNARHSHAPPQRNGIGLLEDLHQTRMSWRGVAKLLPIPKDIGSNAAFIVMQKRMTQVFDRCMEHESDIYASDDTVCEEVLNKDRGMSFTVDSSKDNVWLADFSTSLALWQARLVQSPKRKTDPVLEVLYSMYSPDDIASQLQYQTKGR
ncbi:hypothetical protein WJX77_000845 [Trebouxia sp. C0004]